MQHALRFGRCAGWLGALALVGLALPGQAQSRFGFEHRPDTKVVIGTDSLRLPWAGGLNSVTPARIELDGDGTADLFLWDQGAGRALTFLARQRAGTWRWEHAPGYEATFKSVLPFNTRTVTLRDYDADGRPDLWITYGPQFAGLWRNEAVPGQPGFHFVPVDTKLEEEILTPPAGRYTPLMLWFYMGPAFGDVDNDGDVDILTYDTGAANTLTLFRNTAGAGARPRYHQEINFGGITRCAPCGSFSFAGFTSCRPGPTAPLYPANDPQRPAHITLGGPLLLTDLDGDGDPDVLGGQEYCQNLVKFRNDGTPAQPAFTPAGFEAPYLSGSAHPASLWQNPAPVITDVTFDGKPDLLLSPWISDLDAPTGSLDYYDGSHTLHLYTNGGTPTAPNFQFTADNFLQREMIDLGTYAAPALGDLDGDGDRDLLVGNLGDYEPAGPGAPPQYRARLRFFRNVGTAQRAVFRLEDEDFGRFTAVRLLSGFDAGLRELVPQLADLDGDGDLDLVVRMRGSTWGATTEKLSYLLNRAPAGQLADFRQEDRTIFQFTLTGTPTQARDLPSFFDVDGDGHVDLLLGTTGTTVGGTNKLMYFRNRGGDPDTSFVLADGNFGRLTNMPAGMSPAVADFDGDGQPELLTATDDGELRVWPNLLTSPTTPSTPDEYLLRDELTMVFGASILGHHPVVAAGDLTGDGIPELLVGTSSGGLRLLAHQSNGISGVPEPTGHLQAELAVYPNPAAVTLEIESPTGLVSIELLDALGRTASRLPAGVATHHSLSVADLVPGLYLVRARLADGRTLTRRVVIGQ